MTNAVIYSRLSRDVNGLSTSTDDQEAAARAHCSERGWTVTDVFTDDDVPATEAQRYRRKKRQQYARMLEQLEDGAVDVLVAWDTDRLYRHPADFEDLLNIAERTGLKISTVNGDLTLEGDGVTFARIGAAMNNGYVRKLSANVARKHKSLAEAGKFHGGPRPFGYRPHRIDEKVGPTVLIIDDAEADAIRDAARRVLDGGTTWISLARTWNEQGFTTPRGGRWGARQVQRVLASPAIAGKRVHHGAVVNEHAWEPVVDPRAWSKLQEAMVEMREQQYARGLQRPGDTRRRYLLSGLAVCGRCGRRLIGRPARGKPGYICAASDRTGSGEKGCGLRIMSDRIEPFVLSATNGKEVHRDVTEVDPALVDQEIREQLESEEAKLRSWAVEAAEAGLSAAEIRAGREPIARRVAALEEQLVRPQSRQTFMQEWIERGAPEPTIEEARAVVEELVERIVVRPGGRWDDVSDRVSVEWRQGVYQAEP